MEMGNRTAERVTNESFRAAETVVAGDARVAKKEGGLRRSSPALFRRRRPSLAPAFEHSRRR
jgi:hypothetical protein